MGSMYQRCPDLLNSGRMAFWLCVSEKWIKEEAASGRIPAIPAGKDFLFDRDAVVTSLKARPELKGGPDA